VQKKNYFSKRELKQMLLVGYGFSCGGKSRFLFVTAYPFFTKNGYLLVMGTVCGGKR